jgi:hypothetical protein
MGSIIELNDTLQITKEQGFPPELNLEKHLKTPYKAEQFEGKTFKFTDKPQIRLYKTAPTRNFLVENRGGKWIYWGLVAMVEITHDHNKKTTSGTYKILYLYTPEEMKIAHQLMDRRPEFEYFT